MAIDPCLARVGPGSGPILAMCRGRKAVRRGAGGSVHREAKEGSEGPAHGAGHGPGPWHGHKQMRKGIGIGIGLGIGNMQYAIYNGQ